jgi:hypothetical protein
VLEKDVLGAIRKGTKVRIITQQSPYTKPSLGTKLVVLGVEVIQLSTGDLVDSGDLEGDDVAAMFAASGSVKGYTASAPQVRDNPEAATTTTEPDAYDF